MQKQGGKKPKSGTSQTGRVCNRAPRVQHSAHCSREPSSITAAYHIEDNLLVSIESGVSVGLQLVAVPIDPVISERVYLCHLAQITKTESAGDHPIQY